VIHFAIFAPLRRFIQMSICFCGFREVGRPHIICDREAKWTGAHHWQTLVVLGRQSGAAFLFIELHGAGPELAWWDA